MGAAKFSEVAMVMHEEGSSGLPQLVVLKPARLSIQEAAEFLGVSKDYVYRKSAAGLIPRYKVGKKLEFDPEDLERYRESLKQGGA